MSEQYNLNDPATVNRFRDITRSLGHFMDRETIQAIGSDGDGIFVESAAPLSGELMADIRRQAGIAVTFRQV